MDGYGNRGGAVPLLAADDTVTVEAFFPSKSALTEHECQLVISSEKHIRDARAQLNRGGLYQLSVTMEEL